MPSAQWKGMDIIMKAQNNLDNIVERDIHCPFCNTDNAVLVNKTTSRISSIQFPAFGLKFLFSVLYLSLIHIIINGFKIIEIVRKADNITYGFCPRCGNSYSLAPPETAKEEIQVPKFYRIRDGKVVMGMCKGIAEYTGISLLWIRIVTALYCFTVIGLVLYFLIGACVLYKEDADKGVTYKKFYRRRKGKDLLGVCRGFSEYTDIPVVWVRLLSVLFAIPVVGIAYLVISWIFPYKEDIDEGKQRKKLCKVKENKFILGLCSGFAKYSNMPLWLVRTLTIVLVIPMVLYWIIGAIVPNEDC